MYQQPYSGQPMYQQPPMQPQMQPQYAQPQYQQPQQFQQPYGVQPQQQVMAMPSMFDVQQALAQYCMRNANQTQIGGYIFQRGSQSSWQDNESFSAVKVAQALCAQQLRNAPGMNPQQALNTAIQQTYEVMVISVLTAAPQMIQTLQPNVLQGLLQNIPQLQQLLTIAMPNAGLPVLNLSIPGYTVTPQQQFTPLVQTPQYQQPNVMQQYASPISVNQQQVQHQPNQQSGYVANNGLSNARPVIPPPAGEAHFGMKPIDIGKLNVGTNRVQREEETNMGATARKLNYGPGPKIEPLFKTPAQPQQVAAQPQQNAQPAAPVNNGWNHGVVETYSTPTLTQAIQNQLKPDTQPQFDLRQVPSDINYDSVMALDSAEETALFEAPAENPMPSMQEMFGYTFGARNDPASQAMSTVAPYVPDASTYTHHIPNDQVADLTGGQVTLQPLSGAVPQQATPLSKDGLPDGWMYSEAHYEADSTEFYNLMAGAKRHRSCPWPIGYDRRFCTRLYRFMEDGSIEQKIVGVPMDRLKHDVSLLDTPVPTDRIRDAELADFGALGAVTVNEAVKIVRDPEVTKEIIHEKLGDKSIYVVDKPIYALSRQEAVLMSSLKIKPLTEELNAGMHGFETQVREITLVTSHPDLEAFLKNEHIAMLTQDSKAKELIDLSEAIRSVRAEGLLPDRCLRKVTEHMRDVINTMLYAEYGYGDTLQLEDNQAFEDELVEFVMYMNKSEDDFDILQRIHSNWDNVRARLCVLLTGSALKAAQHQIARRYNLPEEEAAVMLEQMKQAVLLQKAYSITTVARTTKELRVVDNQPAFATMASERPYLHQLMTDIKKRSKASGATLCKHYILTSDGVELGFTQAGLGNGSVFPTFYIN